MKYSISTVLCLFCFICSAYAQSFFEEVKKMEAERKFEAAGMLYHDHYMFSEAIDAFEKRIEFINKQRKPDAEALALADSLLKRSKQVARMISRCEDIQIVDSLILDKESFLKAYFIGEQAGTLIPSSGSIVYENQLKDRRFLAKKDSMDLFKLYSQNKIGNEWTDENPMSIPSEGEGNDNYPYVMPDGMTTYYASTRNGSIGGYDLFITRYNLNSDTYLTPNQMGMPFNSLYNDYLLVIDEENEVGYFASDRFQPEDKVIVYAFIPNEEYISLPDTISDQERINRAQIRSIKNTWKSGMDYSAYLTTITEDIAKQKQKKQRDFTFVINDNILYYTLDDFESDAAKKLFLKYQDIQNEYDRLSVDLEEKREQYATATSVLKKSMQSSVLSSEERLDDLNSMLNTAAKEVRNAEIKYLRQQQ